MARTPGRTHPPAWYPDPNDAGRVRRWDGHGWTDEVRPLPDWLRTLRLSPGPRAIPPPRRLVRVPRPRDDALPAATASRRLWIVSAALVVLSGVLVVILGSGDDDTDRVGDRAFARAANARCARANAALDDADEAEVDDGARVERITDEWEDAVADLRSLPVAFEDERAVDRWLRSWDRWVALGHDYADAVDDGDAAAAEAVLAESSEPKAAISRFALVNEMPDCAG